MSSGVPARCRLKPRLLACLCAALAVAVALTGCGGTAHQATIVARVGETAINSSLLAHWATVISRGGTVPNPTPEEQSTARRQALSFLITSRWLIGEAAQRKVAVTEDAVKQAFLSQEQAMPGGSREFAEEAQLTGESRGDVELTIRAKLDAQALRGELERSPRVTHAQVVAYYKRNPRAFLVSERRFFDLREGIATMAQATRLKREVAHQASLAGLPLHETMTRQQIPDAGGDNSALASVIFTAKPHVVAGPQPLHSLFTIFEVTRVVAARQPRLSEVYSAVSQQLQALLTSRSRAQSLAAFRSAWVARTDCKAGLVVPQCRQYAGRPPTEVDPFK